MANKKRDFGNCPWCGDEIDDEKEKLITKIGDEQSPCFCFAANEIMERDKEIALLKAKIVELESWRNGLLSMKEKSEGVD